MAKKDFIESEGYSYESKWECDFKNDMEINLDMKQYIHNLEYVGPLEPRDAFFGGRTEGFKLYEEASSEQEINYYDVTSLYPYVNKTGKIPLGHPEIVTENFEDITEYEGLIKCKIVPPHGLYIPVLPVKSNKKLLFSLCRTCADQYQQSPCQHTDNERAFLGTWVTDEVKLAISQGYKIVKIYEIWHFENISQYDPDSKCGGLFTEYVNTFLKLKQEASGWPEWCKTEEDKQSYIKRFYDKEGILLDYNMILKNPGLRSLAKLMLNSFWGKFGQRTNLAQTSYVTDTKEFFEFMTNDQQTIKNIHFVNEETIQLDWAYSEDFISDSSRTNVVIAAYTTAQARLKIYSYLQGLGQRCLYTDTDSIFFISKLGQWKPPLGDFLGDLTDEVPGNKITNFVTGGPKNYAYKTERCDKNECGPLNVSDEIVVRGNVNIIGSYIRLDCKKGYTPSFTKSTVECINTGEWTEHDMTCECADGWTKFKTSCYQHFGIKRSWDAAKSACEDDNAQLVSITSLEEYDFVHGYINQTNVDTVWIGANKRKKMDHGYGYLEKNGRMSTLLMESRKKIDVGNAL
ncbi:uncharacterized protein LOC128204947 [Mya arenaria]|uniref:uncharacterized protein LOC128204947 n=1 Tax=Mya arenaria TaxID=6604 RepID=UPI0022E1A14A|nr:uncharacterized protein LOC128204947 [Mya arenaria]